MWRTDKKTIGSRNSPYVIEDNFLPHWIILNHTTPCHITSHYIISYHIISYHIISYHIISYHTSNHIESYTYYGKSYHSISYHIILYYIILYHIISYHLIPLLTWYDLHIKPPCSQELSSSPNLIMADLKTW